MTFLLHRCQSVGHSVSESLTELVSRSVSQSVSLSVSQSDSQSVSSWVSRSVNWSASQSVVGSWRCITQRLENHQELNNKNSWAEFNHSSIHIHLMEHFLLQPEWWLVLTMLLRSFATGIETKVIAWKLLKISFSSNKKLCGIENVHI